MTVEQEEKPKEEDSEATKRVKRINETYNNSYMDGYEKLATLDSFDYHGETYKLNPLTPETYFELKTLATDPPTEDVDNKKYIENFRRRACILIEGMTPEKFDKTPFVGMMLIVTAWSSRAVNFCPL